MQNIKGILMSLMVIGIAITLLGAGTFSYFSDVETSTGNTFTAGTVDISLNPEAYDGQQVVTVDGDLYLKPCQTGYTYTYLTNDGNNPCEVWKHINNVENKENGKVEPEKKYYAAHPGSDTWLISDWIHYDMLVYRPLGYSFEGTTGVQSVSIDVQDGGGQVTWTIDYPGEAPYDAPTTEGNGHWTVGLIIALDGDGNDPAYQVHNNDGTDPNYPWGTWLVSPYYDGSWHSGSPDYENTPVSDLDWISCTGDRYNENNPNGLFTITIDKSELVGDIHWALNLAIGSGFYSTYMTYEQMSYPNGEYDWFDWGNPVVDMNISNYEAASISELIKEIPESAGWFFTYKGPNVHPNNNNYGVECKWIYLGILQPGESMIVIQSYHLDKDVDNWGQSDKVIFDIEFMAQQIEGDPMPPPPGPVLSGHGRP